ncbi:penicillin-binding protein 2 [Ruminiclostridium herbifermentans]|uniref:Penicillin-binding protein 2 n=1 Tax=Ruminiclostridium herbifermentans TaxID=2488810 RepID=A0A4U7JGA1_9FIRM|nr:penicillin-binding protein 2 [Ruminiclostridium herbifermentans]QNU68024.1 penicillin-binding protein 2 [Ruminiclostridium herbifermentans]
MKQFFKDRYNILGISIVMVFALIVYQLVNIQLIQGENYFNQSQSINLKSRTILAERGNILDRYGVPIATNSSSYSLMLMTTGTSSDQLNEILLKLSKILEKNGDTYKNSFSKYLTYNPIEFGSAIAKSQDRIKALRNVTGYPFQGYNQASTAKDVFNYLKDTAFKIDKKYSDEEAYKIMTLRFEIMGYNSLNPVIAENISNATVAEVEERIDEFPGAIIDTVPSRKYVDAEYAAHLIGYVRTVSENDLIKHADEGYNMNDIIGKSGIELTAEGYLRGTNGYRRIEIDDNGKTKIISEEAVKPGSDVVLTIDMRLQKAAMDSLEKNIPIIRERKNSQNHKDAYAGAVVALDVKTGDVLALASYPSYDPSIFLADASDKEAQKAISALYDASNTTTSEYNRATKGIYAPGSTFKPLVGIAGLEEGVINPYEKYFDKGYVQYGDIMLKSIEYRTYKGGLGWVNMIQAIQKSSNPYFYVLGNKVGINNIVKWATRFGLGQKTGIELDESTGNISSREFKAKIDPDPWTETNTAQSAIGQLYNSFTPIQLANYTATIANGGKRFKPHVIKRVIKYDGSIVTETKPEYEILPVKKENMAIIQEGMKAVANSEDPGGTASSAFVELLPIKVAGKTGTAETGNEANHSSNALFICYAPADNPEIAVAVVVERGVLGAYTAPIACDVLKEYFDIKGVQNEDYAVKRDIVELTR